MFEKGMLRMYLDGFIYFIHTFKDSYTQDQLSRGELR